MPATNRAMAPAGAIASTGLGHRCFKVQQPVWAMVQTGLMLFAVFIIARSCARRAYKWWSVDVAPSYGECAAPTSQPQPQPQPQPQRPPCSIMEKSRDMVAVAGTAPGPSADVAGAHRAEGQTNWGSGSDALSRPFAPRAPPAPPLTPPELSTAVFTVDSAPHRQDSFIHQPNPDYMSSTSSSSQAMSPSPTAPRRRSYHRTMAIGAPSRQPQAPPDAADAADADSYPPTSPLLPPPPLPPPPPPPGSRAPGGAAEGARQVDVKGEIISVLDDGGAGWTRHTRVYGGGVCLACAASDGEHGGFYGATVTPEEMG